ncbi:MAG: DUF421 domain-containing protein [Gemmatimonadetes bacterium]|nr:DUF421 domain-containing protein [Gemmatimonadota bacterium]
MLFNGLDVLLRTLVTGVLAYCAIVVLLRTSGKRTLAKWNAFDFVVTVAFGSILATASLSDTSSLAQAVVAFAMLIALQFIVTTASVRSRRLERLVKAQPVLLLHEGELRRDSMRRERVTEAEILAALRSAGLADPGEAAAVVLETDGSFSVIKARERGGEGTLADVRGA